MEYEVIDLTTITVTFIGACVTIATAIVGIITAWIKNNQVKEKDREIQKKNQTIREKNEEIRGYFAPIQVPNEDRRNTILLIALGGTGKTTLIQHLFQAVEADPNRKTDYVEIFKAEEKSGKEGALSTDTKYWFYIADYKGQNIGQLIGAFLEAQQKPYSPLAYGYVESLVIMVDLWPSKKTKGDADPTPQTNYDPERVKKHVYEWNDTALDAVFGLLTKNLKYVCLFINKVDLMTDRSPEADKKYEEAFSELITRIKDRSKKIEHFDIILGSALQNTGFDKLRRALRENSVSHDL